MADEELKIVEEPAGDSSVPEPAAAAEIGLEKEEFAESGASPEPDEVRVVPDPDAGAPGGPEIVVDPDGEKLKQLEDDSPPPGLVEKEDEVPTDQPNPVDQLRPPDGKAPPDLKVEERPEQELEIVDEPPVREPTDPKAETPDTPPVDEGAPEGEAAVHEPPAVDHAPADGEVELPADLYEPPPQYAAGADDQAPPGGADPAPTTTVDDPGVHTTDASVPPAGYDDPAAPVTEDEPIEVRASSEGDGDDPSLLEQVADAVGDLWDDAKDVVT